MVGVDTTEDRVWPFGEDLSEWTCRSFYRDWDMEISGHRKAIMRSGWLCRVASVSACQSDHFSWITAHRFHDARPGGHGGCRFSEVVRHGAILFFVLRNLPLKRLVADALGEIEPMGCSKGSWERLCNSSRDIRACQV